MPIYEYECLECGKITEAWQRFSDAPLDSCEHCSGRVKKLVSHSSFHLKGSGWYVSDYARKSPGSTPAAKTQKNETSTEGIPGKTESAPPKSDAV